MTSVMKPGVEQEGAAEDDRRAVEDLLRRDPAGGDRLVEAAPGRAALRAGQLGAEDAVDEQDRERRADPDRPAHLDDHVELRDRQDDEEDEEQEAIGRERRGRHPAGAAQRVRYLEAMAKPPRSRPKRSTRPSRRSSTPSSGSTSSPSASSTTSRSRTRARSTSPSP